MNEGKDMEKHCKDCIWNRPGWPIMDDRCGHAEGTKCGPKGLLFERRPKWWERLFASLGWMRAS